MNQSGSRDAENSADIKMYKAVLVNLPFRICRAVCKSRKAAVIQEIM